MLSRCRGGPLSTETAEKPRRGGGGREQELPEVSADRRRSVLSSASGHVGGTQRMVTRRCGNAAAVQARQSPQNVQEQPQIVTAAEGHSKSHRSSSRWWHRDRMGRGIGVQLQHHHVPPAPAWGLRPATCSRPRVTPGWLVWPTPTLVSPGMSPMASHGPARAAVWALGSHRGWQEEDVTALVVRGGGLTLAMAPGAPPGQEVMLAMAPGTPGAPLGQEVTFTVALGAPPGREVTLTEGSSFTQDQR